MKKTDPKRNRGRWHQSPAFHAMRFWVPVCMIWRHVGCLTGRYGCESCSPTVPAVPASNLEFLCPVSPVLFVDFPHQNYQIGIEPVTSDLPSDLDHPRLDRQVVAIIEASELWRLNVPPGDWFASWQRCWSGSWFKNIRLPNINRYYGVCMYIYMICIYIWYVYIYCIYW